MYVDYHICWKSSGASLDDASCENWCIAEENIEIDQESANHLANCPNNICASKFSFVKLNLKFCRFVFEFFLSFCWIQENMPRDNNSWSKILR